MEGKEGRKEGKARLIESCLGLELDPKWTWIKEEINFRGLRFVMVETRP